MPNGLCSDEAVAPPTDTRLGTSKLTQTPDQRWRAFALLVAAYFITIVDFTIVNVALPTIGRQLHFPESDLQWVVTAYGLTFAGFLLLGGRAADMLGRRRLLMAGMTVFTCASLVGGLATSYTTLIVMRGIQGLGAALVLPAALSIVTNMFPEAAQRSKALSIWGGVGALGATVGLLAGGILTAYFGWRYIFFFNVPIGAAALILAPKVVPESRAASIRRHYDPFGATSITGALLVFAYAISEAPQIGWAAPQSIAMLFVGAALLATFLVIENKVESPLLPLSLLRVGGVAASNAVGFLFGTSFLTFVFLGTLYMRQVLGYTAVATGAAWTTASVTALCVAFSGITQKAVTKTSPRAVMAFGMALIGSGMLWTAQSPVNGTFWRDLAGPFFVAGIGSALASIPISIGALTGVSQSDVGVASALLNTSRNLGGAIGVAVASSIAASHFHTLIHHGATAPAALTGGLQFALGVCGLTGVASVPVALMVSRRTEHTVASRGVV